MTLNLKCSSYTEGIVNFLDLIISETGIQKIVQWCFKNYNSICVHTSVGRIFSCIVEIPNTNSIVIVEIPNTLLLMLTIVNRNFVYK